MTSSKDINTIYREDIIKALKNDTVLSFKANQQGTFLINGICPNCHKKELYISLEQPYQLACSRLDKCGFTQTTRDRYPGIFEALSEKYPVTAANPNATADAYLSKVRGFPLEPLKGLYKQGQIKILDGSFAEVVQVKLANGYWSRLIDIKKIKANDNRKAMIDKGLRYQGLGWIPPALTLKKGDRVFIVEGIFHAWALMNGGYKAIAAISASNLPWDIIEAHKDKNITWVLAYDNDDAGRNAILKFHHQLTHVKYTVQVALAQASKDWDEIYKEGKLDKKYIEDALYYGALLVAHSKDWKAYLMYGKTSKTFYLLDFDRYLYTVKVNATDYHDDLNKEDNHDGDFQTFKRHVTIIQICNCIPVFKYIQKDSITGEQQYFFNFLFPNKKLDRTVPLPPSSIASARAFSQAILERTPGGNFEATDKILGMLRGEWLKVVKTVKTLSYIGYDEETQIYCFQKFGYKNGQRLAINKEGFIECDHDFIKTSLKSTEVVEAKQDFNMNWFQSYLQVHHLNGLAALAWWTGSLFTQQIKQKQTSWLFLEITGDAGAGKSTLLRFLWKLVGIPNQEGTKPGDGASKVGLKRGMSKVSNLPVVLIEADKESINSQGKLIIQQYPWDDFKDLFDYNGVLRSTGVKDNSNETSDLIFKGALCISQNNSVEASEAILTRIVHLHATREHHTKQLKAVADQLHNLPNDFLAGYLEYVLQHEKQWLDEYFQAFPIYEKYLQGIDLIKHQRIVLTHAQLMAACVATRSLFQNWSADTQKQLQNHIKERAIKRQQRISCEPDALIKFWDTYHYLNEKGDYSELANHSSNNDYIAINLPHFTSLARNYGIFIDEDIKKLFPKSTTYTFVGNKKIRSIIERNRTLNCWLFLKGANNDVN